MHSECAFAVAIGAKVDTPIRLHMSAFHPKRAFGRGFGVIV